MKKLIIIAALAAVSSSSFAVLNLNTSQVCIYNGTYNETSHRPYHALWANLSVPGHAVPSDHEGSNADYKQLSCVKTSVLQDFQIVHVFSAGWGLVTNSYTDCGVRINHQPDTNESPLTSYFEAYQANGQTQCKFLYNAPKWHGE